MNVHNFSFFQFLPSPGGGSNTASPQLKRRLGDSASQAKFILNFDRSESAPKTLVSARRRAKFLIGWPWRVLKSESRGSAEQQQMD